MQVNRHTKPNERSSRKVTDNVTSYLEKINGADPLGQRHYPGIAVRNATGLKWIASNHQSTDTIQIDALTLTHNRRRFMPYGEQRTTQPTQWLGSKGYVGGTKDDTGLTHLGAREYDPTLGRFISVDPIMDLTDPQQWNAYGYANGNPVTFSDPGGLAPCEDSEGGNCSYKPRPPAPEPQDESTSAGGGSRTPKERDIDDIVDSSVVLDGVLVITSSPDALNATMGQLRDSFCDSYQGAQGKIGCSPTSWLWQGIFESWALVQICSSSPAWCDVSPQDLGQRSLDLATQENGLGKLFGKLLGLGRAGNAGAARSLSELRAAADATIPAGTTRRIWGAQVWGTGPNAAASARGLIGRTSADLAKIPNLTVETATKWRDLYQAAVKAGRGGAGTTETAQARVDLMNDIIRTLGGKS